MKRRLNVLIIEDHHIIIEVYKSILNDISNENQSVEFNIETAKNCESARDKIKTIYSTINLDLVFLDLNLPSTEDGKILSGEDLGLLIKKTFSHAKIIILTFCNDKFRLNTILKNIDPDALMLKNDVSIENLKSCVLNVLDNLTYYSETVMNLIRLQGKTEIKIDKIDRQLLYELSRGVKTIDLPKILPLSIGGIESRKRRLKEAFNVSKEKDSILIEAAKNRGFI